MRTRNCESQVCSACGRKLRNVVDWPPENFIPGCEKCARIALHARRIAPLDALFSASSWREDLEDRHRDLVREFASFGQQIRQGADACACEATDDLVCLRGMCRRCQARFSQVRRGLRSTTKRIAAARKEEADAAAAAEACRIEVGRGGPVLGAFRRTGRTMYGVRPADLVEGARRGCLAPSLLAV